MENHLNNRNTTSDALFFNNNVKRRNFINFNQLNFHCMTVVNNCVWPVYDKKRIPTSMFVIRPQNICGFTV